MFTRSQLHNNIDFIDVLPAWGKTVLPDDTVVIGLSLGLLVWYFSTVSSQTRDVNGKEGLCGLFQGNPLLTQW